MCSSVGSETVCFYMCSSVGSETVCLYVCSSVGSETVCLYMCSSDVLKFLLFWLVAGHFKGLLLLHFWERVVVVRGEVSFSNIKTN